MAASNHADVLDQMRAHGLLVDTLEVGRMARCRVEGEREKRGWYSLHEITGSRGDLLIVGSFGVWRGNDQGTVKVDLRKTELTPEQREAIANRIAQDQRRAKAERKALAERAARHAEHAWSRYVPTGESDYLARKGIQAHGVRFSPSGNGTFAVPMLDTAGRVHGLQIIRDRKRHGRDKEYWPAGVTKKGRFHLIGSPVWVVLVAEGYATAASLHEATGLPVAVAFDAGNLAPVARELRQRYRQARVLVCADDDDLVVHKGTSQDPGCGHRFALGDAPTLCPQCQQPHHRGNAGVTAASATALEVDGSWIKPAWADPDARLASWVDSARKITDFNDLHQAEGLHVVRVQIEAHLSALKWRPSTRAASPPDAGGGDKPLQPIGSPYELLERFALVYGKKGMLFDRQEHALVTLDDMKHACANRGVWSTWMEHSDRAIVRPEEVGFDPAGEDSNITCNLWSGWPTRPQAGRCEKLLELLGYMCGEQSHEQRDLLEWVTRWLAYPIQKPGAKMKTCLVVHGPQGTGKNLFFEAIMGIYGRYGSIIGQDAIEDKYTDWASRKLFLIADEVVARADLYHVKNKLKSLITGDWIRIRLMYMSSYEERNHVNIVFLSNEAMPVVLEEDDRRHAVIWTPAKASAQFYGEVLEEIRNGGIEALHDYLLNVDLGDFHPGTPPPNTSAKRELVKLGLDSPMRFYDDVIDGELDGITATVGLAGDWYEAYRTWCGRHGHKPAPQPKFVNALTRKRAVLHDRPRYLSPSGKVLQHAVLSLVRAEPPEGADRRSWYGEHIRGFRDAVDRFKGAL